MSPPPPALGFPAIKWPLQCARSPSPIDGAAVFILPSPTLSLRLRIPFGREGSNPQRSRGGGGLDRPVPNLTTPVCMQQGMACSLLDKLAVLPSLVFPWPLRSAAQATHLDGVAWGGRDAGTWGA